MMPFTITLNLDFATFDCPPFRQTLASDMGISASQLFFTSCVSGSVILSGGTTQGNIDVYATKIEAGQHTLPVLSFQGSGRTVTPPPPASSFPIAIVIGAVAGGVLLLALLLIIVCCCRARMKRQSDLSYRPPANPTYQGGGGVEMAPVPMQRDPYQASMANLAYGNPQQREPNFSSQFDDTGAAVPIGSGW